MHSKRRDSPARSADYLKDGQPLLEAQVVDAADSLAYDTHDIDDALSFGLIVTDDLADLPFWKRAARACPKPTRTSASLAVAAHGDPGADRLAGERSARTEPAQLTAYRHRQSWKMSAAARS